MNPSCTAVLAGLLAALAAGLPTCRAAGDPRVTVVQHVNHTPVVDLEKTIQPLLEDLRNDAALGEVTLVADVIGNSLVVRGTPDAVKQVTGLIQELDRTPRTVLVEVLLAAVTSREMPERIPIRGDGSTTADEILAALKQQGQVQVLARAQLSALNNQPAYVHLGRREPTVKGVMESSQGKTRRVEFENVGLKFSVTTRVNPDETITLEIDLERSDLGGAERAIPLGPAEGEQAEAVDVFSLQTSVSAKSGQTVVLGGLTEQLGESRTRRIVLLTPQLLP